MKYFLTTSWDVIPHTHGATFINTQNQNQYKASFSNSFLQALSTGAAFDDLLTVSSMSSEALHDELERLKDADIVTTTIDYLQLLHKTVVGPTNIVKQTRSFTISGENELESPITISRSIGFGPRFITHQSSLNEGWGVDTDSRLAEIKAIVEGVERYSLGNYTLSSLLESSWLECKPYSMTSRQLNTTIESLTATQQLDWLRFEGLNTPKHILAPLDFSYHPVDYHSLQRLPVCPMNISGVAAHQSREAALVGALLELVEHEALMVTWFGRRATPTIRHASLLPIHQEQIRSLENRGWQVVLKDITLDLTPTVMVVALGPTGKRALTIGSCSAFSLQYATGKALSEVTRTIFTDELEPQAIPRIKAENVNDVLTHSYFYSVHKNIEGIKWLWSEGGEIEATDKLTHGKDKGRLRSEVYPDGSPIDELRYLIDSVFNVHNVELYSLNMTPKEVVKQDIPLVVMRALAPEMARFVVGYNQKPAQTHRFKQLIDMYGNTKAYHNISLHPFS